MRGGGKQLLRWERESGRVLNEVLVGTRVYLECYQLKRARRALVEQGGKPRATDFERDMLEYFDKSAARFGWTEEPPWVPWVREWIHAEEEESRQPCA